MSGERASLRERKKARTRAAIQRHAMRLFLERGYDSTTVEQIADAAEVSHTTFFRYFPTKEDVVLSDEFDEMFLAALRAQPAGLGPLPALRAALRAVFGAVSAEEMSEIKERAMLVLTVPALRAAALDNLTQTIRVIAACVAERTGKPADDPAVRALSGAAVGVMISEQLYWVEHPDTDLFDAIDRALGHLEDGLAVR